MIGPIETATSRTAIILILLGMISHLVETLISVLTMTETLTLTGSPFIRIDAQFYDQC